MTIDNLEVVDIISTKPENNQVVLSICDHLEWGDGEHLLLLQEKLNKYLAFIESGEITETYPQANRREVVIEVVYKLEPDTEATKFFGLCQGGLLRMRVLLFNTSCRQPNPSVKRDCGTGVVSPANRFRAAAPYLQR